MRIWLLALLLLILPFSYALVVESTGKTGQHMVLYGDVAAYERDGKVYVYDFPGKEESEIGSGSNPSMFGFIVAFETKETDSDLNGDNDTNDVVVQYANVRDKKPIPIAAGTHPTVYSDQIAFSTKESELDVDFTNDGDLADDVIRIYDLKSGDITNTKTAGDFPAINKKYVVLQSSEEQIGADLNSDGDKKDVIIRIYNQEDHKVSNVGLGEHPMLSKDSLAVFVSEGKIKVLDAKSGKVAETNQAGTSPSLYGNVILFTRGGQLYGWDMKNSKLVNLDLAAEDVSLSGGMAAFVTAAHNIGYVIEADVDKDGFTDFVDNCPDLKNENQADKNGNGFGDECDTQPEVKPTKVPQETKAPEVAQKQDVSAQNVSQLPVESKGIAWYWYVLVIILLPFIAYYGFKYYKKRQKSFGF
jgi:hypothetical protein